MRSVRGYVFGAVVGLCFLAVLCAPRPALADSGEFSLQVYPSPLVTTVKPGQTSTIDLHIRNNGPTTEDLTIAPRAFKIDQTSHQLELDDQQVPQIASWISFNAPNFSVKSNQTFTQTITFAVPKEAGFSYAFALMITRSAQPAQPSGRTLKGQVAVFALMNVDRPGAVRALEVARFATSQSSYQYLPVEFQVELKNTGNTIVQPGGNIFVQRSASDTTPISTLQLNQEGGYILPGTSRTFTVEWADGFQVMTPKPQTDGTTKDELSWNWDHLGSLRLGKYMAKLVAVYDDGRRDVPLEAETSFWVLPWLMLLGGLVILLIITAGIWSLVRGFMRLSKTMRPRRKMHL